SPASLSPAIDDRVTSHDHPPTPPPQTAVRALTGAGDIPISLLVFAIYRIDSIKSYFPARDDLSVVDVVRNATLERRDHRARGPGYALPQLASLGVGGGVGREQYAVAELAQGRIRGQRLVLEGIDGGAADAPLVDGAGEGLFIHHLAAGGVEHDGVRLHQLELGFAEHVARLRREH